MWVCSSCGSAEPDTTIVDVTFLPQQHFDVAVTIWYQRPRLLFEVPTPPLFPPQQHGQNKSTQILSLISIAPVWSEPVVSCLVQFSPVVPYLETFWSTDLMAYLFTEPFDMHVCFYRFPSMLLCVGHAMPHVTKETEQLLCWTAES